MLCDFCLSDIDVLEKTKCKICKNCNRLSKKVGKNDGIYFNVKNCEYIQGSELGLNGKDSFVIDLHNVTDLLSLEEFKTLSEKVLKKFDQLIILSFVGFNAPIRKEAHSQIIQYMKVVENRCHGYLCFKRGEYIRPGNKGHFLSLLKPGRIVFLDDGEDHISAGKEAGAECHLITKKEDISDNYLRDFLNLEVFPYMEEFIKNWTLKGYSVAKIGKLDKDKLTLNNKEFEGTISREVIAEAFMGKHEFIINIDGSFYLNWTKRYDDLLKELEK